MKIDEKKRRLWEERIQGWLASGLTQRAYCEREGFKRAAFDYWRRRIKPDAPAAGRDAKGAAAQRITLVPLQFERQAQERHVVLRSPGGWQLSVPASVDIAWLAPLLQRLP